MPSHALKEFIVSPVRLLINNIYKYSIYRIRMQSLNLNFELRALGQYKNMYWYLYRDVIILTSIATEWLILYIFLTESLSVFSISVLLCVSSIKGNI